MRIIFIGLLFILLLGCREPKNYWENEENYCKQQGGIFITRGNDPPAYCNIQGNLHLIACDYPHGENCGISTPVAIQVKK